MGISSYSQAGEVDIVNATATLVNKTENSQNSTKAVNPRYNFAVTLKHQDTGWAHYADAWEVLDGNTREVIGVRELLHPHVEEQPFTRSLSGVEVGSKTVIIRARDNVHGYSSHEFILEL